MCKTKMATDAAEPSPIATQSSRRTKHSTPATSRPSSSAVGTPRTSRSPLIFDPSTSNLTGSSYQLNTSQTTASVSSRTSLSSLRESLPENTQLYEFSEIRSATNNFLAKRYSPSSTPSWRCKLRGKDVIVFQRKFRRKSEESQLKERLAAISRSHHLSVIKLLGASISGDLVFLVYDFVPGGTLADCLRNPRIPNFTALSTWISRIQVATDLAHGLDYIHNSIGLGVEFVHKHIKSNSVIVTEPSFNAKICHFGAAELCGETAAEQSVDNRSTQFEGNRGYMSPEFQATGIATQKSDIYAFGVLILELLSGEEPVKYKFDRASGDYRRIPVVETARVAVEGGEGVEGRIRKWMDRRLSDSFPVDVAAKLTRVALECVHVDPEQRPDMRRVAGKISKLYLASRDWSDRMRLPTGISVSFAPR